jgi:hypothetical protein
MENEYNSKKDISSTSAHNLHLRYNNPEGDSTIGYRYSKYKDSIASNIQAKTDDTEESLLEYENSLIKQIRLMTWKNFLIFTRNLKPTIFQMMTPILICILLVFIQMLVDNFAQGLINKNPEILKLNEIPKCKYPEDCITIGYGIIVF